MFRPTWPSSGDKTMVGGIAASGVFYIGCPRCARVEGLLFLPNVVLYPTVSNLQQRNRMLQYNNMWLVWGEWLHSRPATLPPGNDAQYPLDRNQSGLFGGREISLTLLGIESPGSSVLPVAQSLYDWGFPGSAHACAPFYNSRESCMCSGHCTDVI
jgi:hypothetical protein